MDVNGDRLSDLVQPWNNGGRMSIITYLSNGNGFNEGVNFDSRQGSDNLALLPMDVNGDGLSDLVQPWNNGGRISIITYLSNGNGFNEGVNFDSRQGSDNLALLPMDVNGDGLSDLVQPWNNGGRISIITYLSNGNGFNDGLSDLVQPWNNGGRMSIITYFAKN